MLATLVIGLREGLEAALIVGIIAAFLKRNGASLKPMWLGVSAALVLSVAVGFVLQAIEASLPQAAQEGMEAVIGAIAVIFVTTMIVWMKKHSRAMKKELEKEAAEALGTGTTWALAGMAFLAVLKEGFETSVFLLATFQASTSAAAAALGAVIGVAAAVAIGIGLYTGGVKLNLSRFFTITGVFLVFVAGGLVVSALRSAHEAGWIVFGQQPTVDLSWLAPTGSVQAALITGVLGIPADPRVVEVLGWVLYVVPVLAFSVWPKRYRLAPAAVPKALLGGAAVLGAAAIVLAIAVPAGGSPDVPASAPLTNGGTAAFRTQGSGGSLAVTGTDAATYRFGGSSATTHAGADRAWSTNVTTHPSDRPSTLDLSDLTQLAGGRIPVGIDPSNAPGPYTARWTSAMRVSAYTSGDGLVDASNSVRTVVTISGGGLTAPRAFAVPDEGAQWSVKAGHVAAASASIAAAQASAREAQLWKLWLPLAFAIAAVWLLVAGLRGRKRLAVDASSSVVTASTASDVARADPTSAVGHSPRRRPHRPPRHSPTQPTPWRAQPPLGAPPMQPSSRRRVSTGLATAAALISAALVLTGCSSNESTAAKTSSGVSHVKVTLANDGSNDTCTLDHTSAPAGPITFTVENTSATGITEVELQSDERIIGEKENLAPGLKPVSFTLTLGGGKYTVYCPGGKKENLDFTVTGKAAAQKKGSVPTLLAAGSAEYATYVDDQIAGMVQGVASLKSAIDSGDLAAAQKEYGQARPFYERIESDVEGFVLPGSKPNDNAGNLDYLIDMRASNLDPTVGWHGFHAIERDLFQAKAITSGTQQLAAELQKNVGTLAGLAKNLKYKPEDLANGAAGLLEEVQSEKIKGEEEAFSHIDLVDFAANVEGSQQAFEYLKPGLTKIDSTLTSQINTQFQKVNAMLDTYRDPSAIGGYVTYTPALRASDANKLSQAVQALQDPLSRLAEKVATAQ
ncbi:iron uptake system protein EfeO [Humibacter ginsenosidimutans]|uniref:iron uptake system protein EfeO n=1 Tax=Humibacter ginsenosidimutans TaxID=2599293 RepID=UPI00143CE4E4|nr:iron uptake system protein EfeO [Humibacter ginsenosidimutans]